MIEFTAEVKKTSSKKLASLDVEYQTVLATTDPGMYKLGLLPAESLIKVTVEVVNG